DYAACVTAIMCGEAYLQSSKIDELCQPLEPASDFIRNELGAPSKPSFGLGGNEGSSDNRQPTTDNRFSGAACPGWYVNREPFLDVIRMHRASVNNINRTNVPASLLEASKDCWDEALKHGEK